MTGTGYTGEIDGPVNRVNSVRQNRKPSASVALRPSYRDIQVSLTGIVDRERDLDRPTVWQRHMAVVRLASLDLRVLIKV